MYAELCVCTACWLHECVLIQSVSHNVGCFRTLCTHASMNACLGVFEQDGGSKEVAGCVRKHSHMMFKRVRRYCLFHTCFRFFGSFVFSVFMLNSSLHLFAFPICCVRLTPGGFVFFVLCAWSCRYARDLLHACTDDQKRCCHVGCHTYRRVRGRRHCCMYS